MDLAKFWIDPLVTPPETNTGEAHLVIIEMFSKKHDFAVVQQLVSSVHAVRTPNGDVQWRTPNGQALESPRSRVAYYARQDAILPPASPRPAAYSASD